MGSGQRETLQTPQNRVKWTGKTLPVAKNGVRGEGDHTDPPKWGQMVWKDPSHPQKRAQGVWRLSPVPQKKGCGYVKTPPCTQNRRSGWGKPSLHPQKGGTERGDTPQNRPPPSPTWSSRAAGPWRRRWRPAAPPAGAGPASGPGEPGTAGGQRRGGPHRARSAVGGTQGGFGDTQQGHRAPLSVTKTG